MQLAGMKYWWKELWKSEKWRMKCECWGEIDKEDHTWQWYKQVGDIISQSLALFAFFTKGKWVFLCVSEYVCVFMHVYLRDSFLFLLQSLYLWCCLALLKQCVLQKVSYK